MKPISRILGIIGLIGLFNPTQFLGQENYSLQKVVPKHAMFSQEAFQHQHFTQSFSAQLSGNYALHTSSYSGVEQSLPPFKRPLPTMAASLVVPGSGQALHGKWIRAGVYLAVDILGIYQNRRHTNRAQDLEREYYAKVDNNWSVVKYANWLVDYNKFYGTNSELLDIWREGAPREPTFNNQTDWGQVVLTRLRELERKTLYLTTLPSGSIQRDLAFSHTVPDYGSQQYYELASKYWQFAPGWRDFNVQNTAEDITRLQWNLETVQLLSPMWFNGSMIADRFNNHYRYASNWVTVLILNHVFSAFDGLFTAKLAGHQLQVSSAQNMSQLLHLQIDF